MNGKYEATDAYLIFTGPGKFRLGRPWHETIEVEAGKTRRRKIPDDGIFQEPEQLPPVATGSSTVKRTTYVGINRQRLETAPEDR